MTDGHIPSDLPRAPPGELVITLRPIGVVRSPFREKASAPRQPAAARDVQGTIELEPLPGMEHAVCDLEVCDHLWVVFWFHLARDFRPKVLPPRSAGQRRGVLATRSPHRPNPIGLSVVRLDRVDGLTLHIRDVDMLDGTPVLDVKPYVAYTDSIPDARVGWLGPPPEDPDPGYRVRFSPEASGVLAFLNERFGIDLAPKITATLTLGPQPHPYRRIRAAPDGRGEMILAVKDWRARFVASVASREIEVTSIETGYRPRQLALGVPGLDENALAAHRAVHERSR